MLFSFQMVVAGDRKAAMAGCEPDSNVTMQCSNDQGGLPAASPMADTTESADARNRQRGVLYTHSSGKNSSPIVSQAVVQNGFKEEETGENSSQTLAVCHQVAPCGDTTDRAQINSHQMAVVNSDGSLEFASESLSSSYQTATESLSSPTTLCNTLDIDSDQRMDVESEGLDDVDMPLPFEHYAESATKTGAPPQVLLIAATPATPSTTGFSTAVSATSMASELPHMDTLKVDNRSRFTRKKTVLGVTEDARRVLDQFLRRSLSQNDASPLRQHYENLMEMETIEEKPVLTTTPPVHRDESYNQEKPVLRTTPPVHRNESYNQAEDVLDDDDDATSHSPVSKSNSLYSTSSHSSKHKTQVKPMTEKDVEDALNRSEKKKKQLKKRARKGSVSSSTSSDLDDRERRKEARRKKSFFKRATERLRQSFRKLQDRREDELDMYRVEYNEEERKKIRERKGKFKLGSLKRSSSDKSKSSPEKSPTSGFIEMNQTLLSRKGSRSAQPDHFQEDKRHTSRSPSKSKDLKRKDSFLSKSKDKSNKGLLDSLLSQIRRGSGKLKRKGSKGKLH